MARGARKKQVTAARRPDACAVPTCELAPILQEFVEMWTRGHEDLAARVAADGKMMGGGSIRRNELGHLTGNETVGAITILHERTRQMAQRFDPAATGVPKRTIRNVLNARYRRTELRIADALLAAAHRVDAFHDGSVTVVPNPLATAAARASCCGSSLNGAATPPGLV